MANINKEFFKDSNPITQPIDTTRFKWNLLPQSLQVHYNYLLQKVIDLDKLPLHTATSPIQPLAGTPNYYNINSCLALDRCDFQNQRLLSRINAFLTTLNDRCLINLLESFDYYLHLPDFFYKRDSGQPIPIPNTGNPATNTPPDTLDLSMEIHSLTIGSVIWLYYYERMGIFKILGVLLDDYNYKGRYTISSKVVNNNLAEDYFFLIENISLVYRQGLSSNLRDRICLYQRVLGVTIDNNQNIDSEKNEGFMKTFNKLIDYMLDFYKAKQLAVAIQNSSGINVRSSVATQTSIRDTILVMQQHLEPMEYGRNMINTFLGIATVYITICLLRLVKTEIGIPDQYDKPEEFVPAAYDVLVLKRAVTSNTANRFIIYDNCASYGYRLLTDIQLAKVEEFKPKAEDSPLGLWLNDIEAIVEGYNNAYKSIEEPAAAMV